MRTFSIAEMEGATWQGLESSIKKLRVITHTHTHTYFMLTK